MIISYKEQMKITDNEYDDIFIMTLLTHSRRYP